MAVRKRFGEILIDAGVLTEGGLRSALTLQKITGKRLGQVLEERNIITERDVAIVLARQFGLKTVFDIAKNRVPDDVLETVDSDEALKKLIHPLRLEGNILSLAVANPLDISTIDDLSFRTGLQVVTYVTTAEEVIAGVNAHYLRKDVDKVSGVWLVMVVDEKAGARTVLANALKEFGCQVLQADDGSQALEMIIEHPPHLIVTSTLLDGVDGFELMRTLKRNRKTEKIPVIALSYKATVEEEVKVLESGFFDFITKPVNPTRLQIRVKRALEIVYGKQLVGLT
ncbi:MAG TPA: response regulator [Geothermobacteraceae bacterium]|nr:response regulator [Geothermobacteraceae bacterium]